MFSKVLILGSTRLLGLWSPKLSTSPCIKFFYRINNILVSFFMFLYITSSIGGTIINRKKKSDALEGILFLTPILIIGFKLYKFASEHCRIADLTEAIIGPLDALSESTDSNIKQLIKMNAFYEFITDISFGSIVIFANIAVLMLAFSHEPYLPLRGAYPFDTSISPNYEYTILLEAIMINVYCITLSLIDQFIFSLIRWMTVQLVILNFNYQKCCIPGKSTIKTYSPKEFNYYESVEIYLFKLKTCSKNHQHLINFMSEWNSIFNTVMFTDVFISCFEICLTSVQLVMDHKNIAVTTKFILFFCFAVLRLFIWCWFGNELTSQSETVSSGLWSCGWEMYLKHHQIKSLIKISLIQGIRPFEIKAGKFFVMSMETYVKVIKTAYSFFAVLSAVNE